MPQAGSCLGFPCFLVIKYTKLVYFNKETAKYIFTDGIKNDTIRNENTGNSGISEKGSPYAENRTSRLEHSRGRRNYKRYRRSCTGGKAGCSNRPQRRRKTTLAKLIAGIENPSSGRILFDGEDITKLDVTERAQKGIAYAFQQPVRFKGLTVRDLLELAAGGKLPEEKLCALLGQVGPVCQ